MMENYIYNEDKLGDIYKKTIKGLQLMQPKNLYKGWR
jgi:hypothetical protein